MAEARTTIQLKWALVALLALVLGGTALDLASKGTKDARRPSAAQAFPGERFAIPPGVPLGRDGQFLLASSGPRTSSLWTLVQRGASLRVQQWLIGASTVSQLGVFQIASPPAADLMAARIVSWQTRKALMLASLAGRSVIVQVRQAVPPYTVLTQKRTPRLGLAAGSVRSVFVDSAPHSGVTKLIVVDRPVRTAGSMRIRVLTSTTDFQSIVTDVHLFGVNSFPATNWSLVVGGINSPSGDLLFISRTQHTATGKIEVHALLSRKEYHGYGTQMPLGPAEGSGVSWSYVIVPARNGAAATLYGIDPIKRLLMRFPL